MNTLLQRRIAIGLLLVALGSGCSNWAGFGVDASGPEMPRLRQVLTFKPGMSIADIGAGKLSTAGRTAPREMAILTLLSPGAKSRNAAYVSLRAIGKKKQLTGEEQMAAGIGPDMIRLSVGLENLEDLCWDLDQALAASQKAD